jgi:hypothetical protein
VDGADGQTGKRRSVIIFAQDEGQASARARAQGLRVSGVYAYVAPDRTPPEPAEPVPADDEAVFNRGGATVTAGHVHAGGTTTPVNNIESVTDSSARVLADAGAKSKAMLGRVVVVVALLAAVVFAARAIDPRMPSGGHVDVDYGAGDRMALYASLAVAGAGVFMVRTAKRRWVYTVQMNLPFGGAVPVRFANVSAARDFIAAIAAARGSHLPIVRPQPPTWFIVFWWD